MVSINLANELSDSLHLIATAPTDEWPPHMEKDFARLSGNIENLQESI
jgi:hypothetical protein